MLRKSSAQSLKSDSAIEDYDNEEDETIFMADATSSGGDDMSELEKEFSGKEDEEEEEVNEGTSLLPRRRDYEYGKKGVMKALESQSVPNVIYTSPKRPHLPSPSASNPRFPPSSGYLPNNWRTPTMTAYDVQAHPFNRAPNANPQMTVQRTVGSPSVHTETDVTGSSRPSSSWSVEIEQGGCPCFVGIWRICFGQKIEDTRPLDS